MILNFFTEENKFMLYSSSLCWKLFSCMSWPP